MTGICTFKQYAGASLTTMGGPVVATSASSLVLRFAVHNPDTILLMHVAASNSGGAAPSRPSISDESGASWNLLSEDSWSDGTNGTYQAVFWARTPLSGRLVATVSFSASVSQAAAAVVGILGADLSDPKDANANAIKTEHHTSSAASSVSGFSTSSADSIIVAFYASRTTVTAPGTPAGFTQNYDNSSNLRFKAAFQQVSTLQSGISIAFPNATAQGGMIAIAIRPRTYTRKQIIFAEGFEQWSSAGGNSDTDPGHMTNAYRCRSCFARGTLGSYQLVPGRDGVGRALEGRGSSGSAFRINNWTGGGFGIVNGAVKNAVGSYNAIVDGEHICFGCNVRIKSSVGSSFADGWWAVIGFNGTNDRLTFLYNTSTKQWGMTLNPNTTATGTPNSVTPDYVVDAPVDPTGQWVWIECHLYRDGSAGRIEFWQEVRSGSGGQSFNWPHPPWWPAGTVYTPNPHGIPAGQAGTSATMTKIFDFTGDTSVATIGTINQLSLYGDGRSATNWIGNSFDDVVVSVGGVMGQPCYVKTLSPTEDISVSGWSPSTGTNHFAVVDDLPSDTSDYLSASTGNPRTVLGFSGASIGYTPKAVLALQHCFTAKKVSGGNRDHRCGIISGSLEYTGWWSSVGTVNPEHVLSVAGYDPNTRKRWSLSAALAAKLVIDVPNVDALGSAQSLDAETRVYQAFKQIVVTIEPGNGVGGNSEITDDADYDVPLVTGAYNAPLSPVRRGQNALANTHPIDIGICQ